MTPASTPEDSRETRTERKKAVTEMRSLEMVVAPVSKRRICARLAGLAVIASLVMVLGVVAPSSSSATDGRPGPAGDEAPSFAESESVGATSAPAITIIQDTVPNSAQDFSFTSCQGVGCGPFALDDDADSTLPNSVTGSGMAPGTYTITQAPGVSSWVLDDIFCDTGEAVDVENRTVTITLGAAEEVTCTFLNRSPSIKITVDATPNAPQDFSFTGCQGAGCGLFVLDDDADGTLPNSVTGSALAPGTYTITQAPTANWSLDALSCNTVENVDLANRRVTITLGSDEYVTCTFSNRSTGIVIVQDAMPDGPQDFGYYGCQGAGCAQFALDDDFDTTLPNTLSAAMLAPGTYTITQDVTPGFEVTGVGCSGDNDSSSDVNNRRAIVRLQADEVVTCTFSNRPNPPPLTGVTQISTGQQHSCAVLTNGEARCWGSNEYGQLGDGTRNFTYQPVGVTNPTGTGPLTDIVQIAAGGSHTCARLVNGEARCWGRGQSGQLGQGVSIDSHRPVAVSDLQGVGPLTDVGQIATGSIHTCARLVNGEARCWGGSYEGALGDGTTANLQVRPVVVTNPTGTGPLTDIVQIAAGGSHTCARLVNGEARCWGGNHFGAIGDGTSHTRTRPVVVSNPLGTGPLTGVVQIAAGQSHTCALVGRQARCWGYNNSGLLGDGTFEDRARPVVVLDPSGEGPLTNVAEVTAGGTNSCARLLHSEARCWGYLVGDGTSHSRLFPVAVSNPDGTGTLGDVAQVSSGGVHTCARLANGEARCWGNNNSGELGTGIYSNDRTRPVTVISP